MNVNIDAIKREFRSISVAETKDTDNRFSISKIFLKFFFGIIIGILTIFVLQEFANYIFKKEYCSFNLKEILTIFLTSLTPLVGFILGHYLKNKS